MSATDYSKLFDLTGKRALVIGAGGIGGECVAALAANGAGVTVVDVDRVRADSARERGAEDAAVLDITDAAAVDAFADRLAADVVVITAAVNVRKRIADYTEADLDKVIGLNLYGSFHVLRAFGKAMAGRGGGSLIAFSSIRGRLVEPGQSVYAATKAGVEMLIRTAAAEFGPAGVRANAIAPGVVETPLTAQIKEHPEWYEAYARGGALGRWAQPTEIPGAVVYLASDAASFVTGATLYVDGGWTAVDGRFDPPN